MLRASRRRVSSLAMPCSTTIAVGNWLAVVNSITKGSVASSGRSVLALFCTSRRRSVRRLSNRRSSMSSKRTLMSDMPSRVLLITNLTSDSPCRASSSGWVTSFSTSSAEAPGRAVNTVTQLKLISGSWARGNWK